MSDSGRSSAVRESLHFVPNGAETAVALGFYGSTRLEGVFKWIK